MKRIFVIKGSHHPNSSLFRKSSSSTSTLFLYLVNSSSSFLVLCSFISFTLGSEFHYVPSSSSSNFQRYPHPPLPIQHNTYPHHPNPNYSFQYPPHRPEHQEKRNKGILPQVQPSSSFPAFPKNVEDLRQDYFPSLFNKISSVPSPSSIISNSIPPPPSSSSSSAIRTRRLDLATRPREGRRGIVDDVGLIMDLLPAIRNTPSPSVSPALPFLQIDNDKNGLTKSSFSSRFVGSQLQVQNEQQSDDEKKNEIEDDDGNGEKDVDGWKGLLGPTIQPKNSTNKMTKSPKNSKIQKDSHNMSTAVRKDPKTEKLQKSSKSEAKNRSVTYVSKSVSGYSIPRISKGLKNKVPKIGINRSTSHVTVSRRIGSKSSLKQSNSSKSNSTIQTLEALQQNISKTTISKDFKPDLNKSQQSYDHQKFKNAKNLQQKVSRALQTPPITMLTLDPNSLIIKPSLQIYTKSLEEENSIQPTSNNILMDINQISYLQPQPKSQPLNPQPQVIPMPYHQPHQFLQRNPYSFIRSPFEIDRTESARMASNKNYYFKGEDSDENDKDGESFNNLPAIVDPQHPVVQNALNPLGNPAKEPEQINKKHLRILDPTSLIPLNKTYVYLGLMISWIVFFFAAFSYTSLIKQKSKGGGGHGGFSDKTGQVAQELQTPLVFSSDGSMIFQKRALDTTPGSQWNFTKVLEYIEIAQKTYAGFDWQNLECQQRVLCELSQKDNWAGETGRKITNDYLLSAVDAISGIPFPRVIQAILTEYKEAISQGKNSTKECGTVYNKCKFSLKEVIASAGKKKNDF